ncbi:MAG: M48 family metallopeptidase [Candidatus Hodarchaeales archaeon]|jgi:Zn-dependent protease with chaperone function
MTTLIDIQDLIDSFSAEQKLSALISIGLFIIFFLEVRKYLKYRSYPDIMELSGIGVLTTTLFTFTNDFLLSGLAGVLGIMIIGTFEVRENPIWARMMGTFTISYGFFFVMVLIGFISTEVIPDLGVSIKNFLVDIGFNDSIEMKQFFTGIGYNLIIWVMVLTAFILFGRKFIIVTRFISPQMTYLILYLVALLLILQLNMPEIVKYPAIFVTNFFLYLISGPLLTFLYGIKPLEDKRVEAIIKEVQMKIKTPIRQIGIIKAPILNAFAFGPWFDQRIAYIASDLDKFTDSEIRGITAHELVHVQKKHTLILLVITAVELIVKAIIDAPATYWEYVFLGEQTWDFLAFWLFNIILFAFLLTFVKMLEGQADKITREKGYGIELAESLFRLEGFYYGIAGEIGFNTQLMTGKERSKDENLRFMGDQAHYLFQNLAPSRLTCLMNLIAAHPLTSIRITMQINHSIGTIRAGLMIWALLIPGLRKRTIKMLQKSNKEMASLLSEKYSRNFGEIADYLEITYEEDDAKKLVGQFVLTKPKMLGDPAYWGRIEKYQITDNIVSPIQYELKQRDGTIVTVLKGEYDIVHAEPDNEYFDKNGRKLTLKMVEIVKGKFKRFHFLDGNKKIQSKSIGLDISSFDKKRYWFVYKNGAIQRWTFKEAQIMETFQDSTFTFTNVNGKEFRYTGKELIIDLPPLIQMIKQRNWGQEKHFFSKLNQLDESIILYDKEDFDIGAPTKILSSSDDSIEILEGRTAKAIHPNKLDAIILGYPFHFFNLKNEMGFGSRISLKIFNRGTKINYIGL